MRRGTRVHRAVPKGTLQLAEGRAVAAVTEQGVGGQGQGS